MINIGNLLKEKRIEKNLSIDDIANITKLTRNHIIAIENGDIEPFRNDLSYLSYYIRHYANAVGIDYESLRDEVNEVTAEWTQTIDIVAVPEGKDKTVKQSRKKAIKKNLDYSFMAFVVATILLIVLFVYLGVRYLPGLISSEPIEKPGISTPELPDNKPPVSEPGTELPTPPTTDKKIEIISVDDEKYEVINWNEDEEIEFEVKFGAKKTWVAVNEDGKTVADPVSKVYIEGESIKFTSNAVLDREIMFHLGVMANNEIFINGEKIKLTEKITNTKGVVKLRFRFVVKEGETE